MATVTTVTSDMMCPVTGAEKMLTVGGVRVRGLNRKETECLILVTDFQHVSAPLGSQFGVLLLMYVIGRIS